MRNLPDEEIAFNLVYPGGFVAREHNSAFDPNLNGNNRVQSFQVEYDTIITHNQETLDPNPKRMKLLKAAAEEATYNLCANLR